MAAEPRTMLTELSRAWWPLAVVGAITVAAGLAAIAWPGRTVVVVALAIGIQLSVAGIARLIAAFAVEEEGHRAWDVLVGLASIVVGILCLKDVFQTIAALSLIVGIMWVVQGIAEFFAGIAGVTRHRGLTVLTGILGFVAGVVVLTYPIDSVLVLAVVLGVWLTVSGAMQVAAGLAVRRLAAP